SLRWSSGSLSSKPPWGRGAERRVGAAGRVNELTLPSASSPQRLPPDPDCSLTFDARSGREVASGRPSIGTVHGSCPLALAPLAASARRRTRRRGNRRGGNTAP